VLAVVFVLLALAVSVIALGVSSSVDADWLSATGASLIALIVMLTVARLLSSEPSFALNVKLSLPPWKPGFGV